MIVAIDKELEELFPRYLRNREEDMLKIKAALETNDFESLRHIGHKLAGNASGYGLTDLGTLARDLERAARGADLERCGALFQQMRSYLDQLEVKFV